MSENYMLKNYRSVGCDVPLGESVIKRIASYEPTNSDIGLAMRYSLLMVNKYGKTDISDTEVQLMAATIGVLEMEEGKLPENDNLLHIAFSLQGRREPRLGTIDDTV